MRMFVKVSIPVEVGNRCMAEGNLAKIVKSIVEEQKPEAAYFMTENGQRTCYLFLDLKNTSDLPAIEEPWFLALNASIDATPAMTLQDLATGAPGMETAVRKYGARSRGAGAD